MKYSEYPPSFVFISLLLLRPTRQIFQKVHFRQNTGRPGEKGTKENKKRWNELFHSWVKEQWKTIKLNFLKNYFLPCPFPCFFRAAALNSRKTVEQYFLMHSHNSVASRMCLVYPPIYLSTHPLDFPSISHSFTVFIILIFYCYIFKYSHLNKTVCPSLCLSNFCRYNWKSVFFNKQ